MNTNRLLLVILLIFIFIMMIGSFPMWSYSASWGYWPGGLFGFVLLILIIIIIAKEL